MVDLKEGLEQTLGPGYTVERELSGGGMSRVFVANDTTLGRRVVVKVLPAELAASVSVERFKREIMLAATLQHPHIVGVLSAGEIVTPAASAMLPAERVPYFTMPFVEGESLRARIQREGRLPVGRTVSILKDVARALAYAHERGVVHRDIKPDNVLLAGTSATVTDFGIAKALLGAITGEAQQAVSSSGAVQSRSGLTALGTTLGTPAYMAPEQAAADPNTDHRADLYSFGIMAYEMLTGQVPFKSTTPQALLAAQLTAAPPPMSSRRADVPAALTALVMACLEKDPAKRPQSAREIAEMLEHPDMVSGAFASAPTPAARRPRRMLAGVAIVAVLLLTTLGYRAVSRQRQAEATLAHTRDSVQAAANERAHSIVVLPFVNIGRDSADNYLADGLTNDLITALAKVPGLRVTSQPAARSARERFSSAAEIGQALNAGRILEGTVQREGNRLRVTARVSNAADGFMVWSDMFERQIRDVFAVQDEISTSIARVLGTQMADTATQVANARGTSDDVAYDLYLRGRYFFDRRGAASLRRALDLFSQAVKKDATFAAAYAGMAEVYGVLPMYSPSSARDSLFAAGFAAASHAIQLDSGLAQAYAARGSLLGNQWRWRDAERDLMRAIALDPKYASAHQWYGEQLLMQGRTTDAVDQLARAATLDPVSAVVASSYSLALGLARRDAQAVAQARRAMELDSTLFVPRLVLGMDHVIAGRATQAIQELEPALGLGSSPYVKGALGYAYVAGGQRPNAMAMVQELSKSTEPDALAATAIIQVALGDSARALGNLEQAVARHAPFFNAFPLSAPLFDPVRPSPRFQAIVKAVDGQ